jgi:hypothetical protein
MGERMFVMKSEVIRHLYLVIILFRVKLERILAMVYVEHGYLVSGLYPSSSVQKNKSDKNTTFRRLDLSPSSGGWGRVDLFSWAR